MRSIKFISGVVLFLFGLSLLLVSRLDMTGNIILENSYVFNFKIIFILEFILIIGGLIFMITGSLENRFDERKYDGVIILGGNWRGYPLKFKTVKKGGKEILDISLRSKMNCTTAAEMYRKGLTGKIIIGTGQSAGKKWPSEARAMKDYIIKKYGDVRTEDILTQEKTMETFNELDEDIKLARENGLNRLALVTVNTQMPKCKRYLKKKGENLDYISSEEEFKQLNSKYHRLAEQYAKSPEVRYYERFKEATIGRLPKQITALLGRLVRGKSS